MKFTTIRWLLLWGSVFLLRGSTAQAGRPSFLIILTDDQGYGDISAYRASDVNTPKIDRIGSQGMLFTTMRANCTVCSPSRAALLRGRYLDDGIGCMLAALKENGLPSICAASSDASVSPTLSFAKIVAVTVWHHE
jgi:hypothetical protein